LQAREEQQAGEAEQVTEVNQVRETKGAADKATEERTRRSFAVIIAVAEEKAAVVVVAVKVTALEKPLQRHQETLYHMQTQWRIGGRM
jgi:prephenate dehydrogenase